MTIIYVRFTDETQTAINGVFGSPQDPAYWENLGEVEDDDPRYIAYMNPPPNWLAINSEKLQALKTLAEAQKSAISVRISILQDAVDMIGVEGMEDYAATPAEEAELPVRKAQLTKWKNYAILLGRVTTQVGWPPDVKWPVQPSEGMDLSVSAVEAEEV